MSSPRSPGAPLEQSCVRPGLWRIGGYTVERRKRAGTGAVRWWISRADERGAARHVAVVADLGRARDRIRQELTREPTGLTPEATQAAEPGPRQEEHL